jgi:hypothetical protein
MTDFGGSYPPGCNGPPEGDDDICLLCGSHPDECNCPECQHEYKEENQVGPGEKCGVIGCIEHMTDRELVNRIFRIEAQFVGLNKEMFGRERAHPLTCGACGHVQASNLITEAADGSPACEVCQRTIGGVLVESIFEDAAAGDE